MTEQQVTITIDLEARTAAMFVQTASKFTSSIKLQSDNRTVNAKSIMGIISLGISNGQDVTIFADGSDEKQAASELESFLKGGSNN